LIDPESRVVDRPARDSGPATREPAPCFDPALAHAPTRVVPAERVIDLLEVTHASERIAEFREAMRRGERFPPVATVVVAGRFFLADGHKRFTACRPIGGPDIVVQVWTLRHWLRDQWRQLRGKTAQQLRLATRSIADPAARREARRLVLDTVGHWRRIASSLYRRLRRP
jgi:hypothetical protein